ncbi:hypothetical protein GQ53DRAFT_838934 [Thozetella sp. PMI_491]|nr:hypothetical protein GQ53DRAFT_838934 [Thozetella sp. PMI_491]
MFTSACVLLFAASAYAIPAAAGAEADHAKGAGGKKGGGNNAGAAANSTAPKAPAAGNATAAKTIPVVVGGAQLSFTPNQVVAAKGDIVEFQFSNGAHTVTQSAEDTPCVPLQDTMPNAVYSGRIPFQSGQMTVGTFRMMVNTTQPMFLYCSTGPHCQLGQVMVINPATPEQIVNYAKKAAMATSNTDAKMVFGGTVGQIPLAQAAFVPAMAPMAPPAAPAGGESPTAPAGEAPTAPAGEAPTAPEMGSAMEMGAGMETGAGTGTEAAKEPVE